MAWLGGLCLTLAVALMVVGRAAGTATLPRLALVLALVGLVIWYAGVRQVLAWWLPFLLVLLTIPIPETMISAVTMPLQGVAATIGAKLLALRGIPVLLSGNIITVPGHRLFVSEACSGLHSLTALIGMAILLGALLLRTFVGRISLLVLSIVAAVLMNGFRVFLTGFLVVFVSPSLGEGFMHLTEGYLLFLVSLAVLGGLAFGLAAIETRVMARTTSGTTYRTAASARSSTRRGPAT